MSEPPSLLHRLRLNPAAEDVVGLGSPFSPFGLFRSATRLFTSQSSLPLLSSPLLARRRSQEWGKRRRRRRGGGAAPTNNPLPLFSLPSFGMLVFSTGSVRPSSTSSSVIFCRVSLLGLVSVTCGKHVQGKERLQFVLDRFLIVFKSSATSP